MYDFFLITICARCNRTNTFQANNNFTLHSEIITLQSHIYVKWPLRNDHEDKIDSIYHNVFPKQENLY